MSYIVLMTPSDSSIIPTKTLDDDLKVVSSYPKNMKFFKFTLLEYENIHDLLKKTIFLDKSSFIVLGDLTEKGQELVLNGQVGYRRKKGSNPTIKDKVDNLIVLDIDDHILPNFDALNPVLSITNYLEEHKINADVTWQLTSSQQLNTELARIRLFFNIEESASLQERKAWSQMTFGSDGSVYTATQPIYTAPPIIDQDPIINRTGFIKGCKAAHAMPKLTPTQVQQNSNSFVSAGYSHNISKPPEDFLLGRVYRRYLMPLAFHYANLLQDEDAVFYIIAGVAEQSPNRAFNEENVRAYIKSAIDQVLSEREALSKGEAPKEENVAFNFPSEVFSQLPEPWPMLWNEFNSMSRKPVPELIYPTLISCFAFFLKGSFVTGNRRLPNMVYLALAKSTASKDVNSKNIIRDIRDQLYDQKMSSLFSDLLSSPSMMTSDTAIVEAFNEQEELFWINTEATRFFHQLSTSKGNSAMQGAGDKLIEISDGKEITNKKKAGIESKTIQNPNCQVLLLTQTDTFEKSVSPDMIDSGLVGRPMICILPHSELQESDIDDLLGYFDKEHKLGEEFCKFITDHCWDMNDIGKSEFKERHSVSMKRNEAKVFLDRLKKQYFAKMRENSSLEIVLKRGLQQIEQLFTVIVGVCRMYDVYKKRPLRSADDISSLPLLSIFDYHNACKVYTVEVLVPEELDEIDSAVHEIVNDYLTGKLKGRSNSIKSIIKNELLVPRSEIIRAMKKRHKLIDKLDSHRNKNNVTERAYKSMDNGVRNQTLIGKKLGRLDCIGIPAD